MLCYKVNKRSVTHTEDKRIGVYEVKNFTAYLSPAEIDVMVHMSMCANNNNEVTISQSELAKELYLSERHVRRIIFLLEKYGNLKKICKRGRVPTYKNLFRCADGVLLCSVSSLALLEQNIKEWHTQSNKKVSNDCGHTPDTPRTHPGHTPDIHRTYTGHTPDTHIGHTPNINTAGIVHTDKPESKPDISSQHDTSAPINTGNHSTKIGADPSKYKNTSREVARVVLNDVLKLNFDVRHKQMFVSSSKYLISSFDFFFFYTHSSYKRKKNAAASTKRTAFFPLFHTKNWIGIGNHMTKTEKSQETTPKCGCENSIGTPDECVTKDVLQEKRVKEVKAPTILTPSKKHLRPEDYLPLPKLVPDPNVTNHVILRVIRPMRIPHTKRIVVVDGVEHERGFPRYKGMMDIEDLKRRSDVSPIIPWHTLKQNTLIPSNFLPSLYGWGGPEGTKTRSLKVFLGTPAPRKASDITDSTEILRHTTNLWTDLWKHLTNEDDYRLKGILKSKRSQYRQYIIDWWETCAMHEIKPAEWLLSKIQLWRKNHRYKQPAIKAILNADKVMNGKTRGMFKSEGIHLGMDAYYDQYASCYVSQCAWLEHRLHAIWIAHGCRCDDDTIRELVRRHFPHGLNYIHDRVTMTDTELYTQENTLKDMVREGRFIWSIK